MKFSINDLKTDIKAAKASDNQQTTIYGKISNNVRYLGYEVTFSTKENAKEDIYPFIFAQFNNECSQVRLYYTFNQLKELRDDLNKFQTIDNYIETLLLKKQTH